MDRWTVLRAWSVWGLLAVLVVVWSLEPVKRGLSVATLRFPIPGLHNQVLRPIPGFPDREPMPIPAIYTWDVLAATGTSLMIVVVIGSQIMGATPAHALHVFAHTVRRLVLSLATISTLMALAHVIRFSGMDTTLGLAASATGPAFPFVSPLIGYLGVALTGSGTSSNVLFATLQKVAARQIDLDPIVTVGANVAAGPFGGMVSIQSTIAAMVATHAPSPPASGASPAVTMGSLLRFTFPYSIAFILVFGLWNTLLAYTASSDYGTCYDDTGAIIPGATSHTSAFLSSC